MIILSIDCSACCSYMHDHIRAIVDLSISIAQETNCSPNIRQLASHIIATIGAQNGGRRGITELMDSFLP